MALTKITTGVIAANTLATGNIADNSVDATKIASNSILTRHIDDDQITGDQLADDITIAGNLTVQGTTTTLNTATLDVEDKNITLNKGSGDTSGSADGAGFTIQDAVDASNDASLTWNASGDKFVFSHPLDVTGTITFGDSHTIGDDGDDNLTIASSGSEGGGDVGGVVEV